MQKHIVRLVLVILVLVGMLFAFGTASACKPSPTPKPTEAPTEAPKPTSTPSPSTRTVNVENEEEHSGTADDISRACVIPVALVDQPIFTGSTQIGEVKNGVAEINFYNDDIIGDLGITIGDLSFWLSTSTVKYDGDSDELVCELDQLVEEVQPEPTPAPRPLRPYTQQVCLPEESNLAILVDEDGVGTSVQLAFDDTDGNAIVEILPIDYEGNFIHLSEDPDGCEGVLQVEREDESTVLIRFNRGGFVDEIPNSENLYEPDWSTFNDEIVSHEADGTCVVGDRGDARRRTLDFDCFEPDTSPDGMWVGATDENGQLVIANHSGQRYGYQVVEHWLGFPYYGTQFTWAPEQQGFAFVNKFGLSFFSFADKVAVITDPHGIEIAFNPDATNGEGLMINDHNIYNVVVNNGQLIEKVFAFGSDVASFTSLSITNPMDATTEFDNTEVETYQDWTNLSLGDKLVSLFD